MRIKLTAPLRIALALCLMQSIAGAAPNEAEGEAMAAALAATRSGDWPRAEAALEPVAEPAAREIIDWIKLRSGAGFWEDYTAFFETHADWPGLDELRRAGEASIPAGADAEAVVAYFATTRPQTGAGVIRLADAYTALKRPGDAEAEVVRAWRSMLLNREDEALLLARFSEILAPHHTTRLDMLLWRGKARAARRMFRHVSRNWRKLAEARIALRGRKPGVDRRIAAVPDALGDDPGLAYERFNWRARKGRTEGAIEILRARSRSAEALGEPGNWAGWRRSLARLMMREGKTELAYELASKHFLVTGRDFADLEWLSGYLALTRLGEPELAVGHFLRFRNDVTTPISLGRAGYWLGRAYSAMGQSAKARAAYAKGAHYQTSFYGQLAAERGGITPDAALAGTVAVPDWQEAAFAQTSVLKAALLFHAAGDAWRAERFFTHIAASLDAVELVQLGDLVLELGNPHIAVRLAKRGARRGLEPVRSYYPLTALTRQPVPVSVPMELALAIARRESEFDPTVISPAGARGLMQLMPGTARAMARRTGVQYSHSRLVTDWKYNAALGTAYLAELVEEFRGSMVLTAAAYNAGPGRVRQWIDKFGDPRATEVNVVDWIEHIPLRETRNYVMRVMESLHVYRARLAGKTGPLRLTLDLKGVSSY